VTCATVGSAEGISTATTRNHMQYYPLGMKYVPLFPSEKSGGKGTKEGDNRQPRKTASAEHKAKVPLPTCRAFLTHPALSLPSHDPRSVSHMLLLSAE
jgi:hypothetical protein